MDIEREVLNPGFTPQAALVHGPDAILRAAGLMNRTRMLLSRNGLRLSQTEILSCLGHRFNKFVFAFCSTRTYLDGEQLQTMNLLDDAAINGDCCCGRIAYWCAGRNQPRRYLLNQSIVRCQARSAATLL